MRGAYAGSNASYISLYLYESPAVHTFFLKIYNFQLFYSYYESGFVN